MIITIRGTFLWRGIGAARLATIQAMFDNELQCSGMHQSSIQAFQQGCSHDRLDKRSDYAALIGRLFLPSMFLLFGYGKLTG
jgi:hypothetical protein